MSSPYRPSPFTSHPTVVMAEDQVADQPKKRSSVFRWVLLGLLAITVVYAVWFFAQ